MKKYNITVNGKTYSVEVEEVYSSSQTASQTAAPAPAPAAAPVSAPSAAPAGAAGDIRIEAQVPGKIVKIPGEAGQSVKKGDTVVIVESMKMEIPIVAPEDGTIAQINVAVGDSVETGDLLASMNA